MERNLICEDCNMVFRSSGLLEKHKALLCIGSSMRNSDSVGGVDPKRTRTTDLVQIRGERRTIVGWRRATTGPDSGRRENKPEGAVVQNLTDELHKLTTSFEENLINVSKTAPETKVPDTDARMSQGSLRQQLGHSKRLKQMREMASLHERQLAGIRIQHQQLEQQRDELAHQVTVLAEQNNATHVESLLVELREQEERNEETLQHLREHLRALDVQPVSEASGRSQTRMSTKTHHEPFELRFSVDGPLSAQINALRHTYLQSGGSDPAVVAQMIDLQAEAQRLESNQAPEPKAKKKNVKAPPRWGPSWELLVVEQENKRLEEEILRLQMARNRHAAARPELELPDREKLQREIFNLQAEIERTKAALRLPRQHPSPPHAAPLQSKTHTQAPLSLHSTRSSHSASGRHTTDSPEPVGPAPYDPVAGFVVFFDLMTGVDSSQKVLRLVSSLYSDGHEMTLPAPTPCVQCQPGEPHGHHPGNYAVLSVKQPLPRIQPSPSILLVVEVQAAKDLNVHHQEGFKLVACGWTQLELFDQHNQLRSGYWRVPVHSLPLRSSGFKKLNSNPKVGNMELYVRLVEGRDEHTQTLLEPNPTSCGYYQYPPGASSPSHHGHTA